MGAPVFAQSWSMAALVGPTGGYLVAFPAAAWVAGRIAGRPRAGGTSLLRLALAAVLGGAFILASGAAWLSLFVGGVVPALAAGVAPFLLGDALKTVLALLLARAFRRRILALL
jgi:biotin transport system substrate-specific component